MGNENLEKAKDLERNRGRNKALNAILISFLLGNSGFAGLAYSISSNAPTPPPEKVERIYELRSKLQEMRPFRDATLSDLTNESFVDSFVSYAINTRAKLDSLSKAAEQERLVYEEEEKFKNERGGLQYIVFGTLLMASVLPAFYGVVECIRPSQN